MLWMSPLHTSYLHHSQKRSEDHLVKLDARIQQELSAANCKSKIWHIGSISKFFFLRFLGILPFYAAEKFYLWTAKSQKREKTKRFRLVKILFWFMNLQLYKHLWFKLRLVALWKISYLSNYFAYHVYQVWSFWFQLSYASLPSRLPKWNLKSTQLPPSQNCCKMLHTASKQSCEPNRWPSCYEVVGAWSTTKHFFLTKI